MGDNDLFWKNLYIKKYFDSKVNENLKYFENFKLCYQLSILIIKLKLNYSLYELYYLENLNLTNQDFLNNELKSIPKEIGQLTNLVKLNLSPIILGYSAGWILTRSF